VRVFDLFQFSHELDLLECRLETLDPVVSQFIIVESRKSHTLLNKPLNFKNHHEKYKKFLHKIKYITIDFNYENPFYNDMFCRDYLFKAIENPQEDDIIIHGDLDEIPRVSILQNIIDNLKEPCTLMLENMIFCVDLTIKSMDKFPGPIITKYKWIKKNLHEMRNNRGNVNTKEFNLINDGGWHYTYFCPIENIIKKLKYFAHAAETKLWSKDYNGIKNLINTRKDFVVQDIEKIEVNETNILSYILTNKEKFDIFFSNYYK